MAKRVFIDLPRGTIDETGHRYGYLTVREYAGVDPSSRAAMWLCDCECAQEGCLGTVKVRAARLRSGSTISCGKSRAIKGIREAARKKVPAKRRIEIARMGAEARKA